MKNAYWIMKNRPGFDGRWHAFDRMRGSFPTGLVTRVKRLFPLAEIRDDRIDPGLRRQVKADMLGGVTLADFQIDAVQKALLHKRGVLALATNAGKTPCGAAIAMCVKGKTLWLVHRKDLLHQTAEMVAGYLGEPVGKVGDGLLELDGSRVVVGMVQSLNTIIKADRKALENFTTLLIDEAQHQSATTWFFVAQCCPAYYRFGLSGTPWTDDQSRNLRLEATTGVEIAKVGNAALIERGWSARPTVYYHEDFSGAVCDERDWATVRRTIIEDCPNRNLRVVEIVQKSADAGKPVLVICDTIRHAKIIHSALLDAGAGATLVTGKMAGADRVTIRKDFKGGLVPIIVATSVYDEGVNLENMKTLVIAAGGRSAVRFLQRVGRALRTAPGKTTVEIHDFVDKGSKYTLKHTIERITTCRKEGFEIVEVGGATP